MSGRERLFTRDFLLIWIVSLTGFLSFYLIQQPTLPLYVEHLGGTASTIGWVAGAFSITTLACRPLAGRTVDTIGRRPLVIVGVVVFIVVAPLYAAAFTIPALLAIRLLNGAGMASFTTSGNTYVADLAPTARRAETIGYYGIANNLAMGTGPLAAALLLRAGVSYQRVFLIAGAVAVIGFIAILLAAESPHVKAPPRGWTWDTFVNRRALPPSVLMFTAAVTYGAVGVFIAIYGQDRGLGTSAAAWFFGAYAVTLIVVRLFSGRIADRFGRPAAIIPGMLMVAASMWIVAAMHSIPVLVLAAIVYGTGFGFVYPALLALTVDRVGTTGRGTAMATFSASFDVGIGGGAILLGLVAEHFGYAAMYVVTGLIPVIGMVLFSGVLLQRRRESQLADLDEQGDDGDG